MDPSERMVLRRRKSAIMSQFQLSGSLLNDLQTAKLLNSEAVQYIELGKSNSSRVGKLIDTLISMNTSDAFAKFVYILASYDERMSSSLQSDLRIERGEVHPDRETMLEAAMAVHMKFGTSKKFAEMDKRIIAELIATRLAVTKEEWQQELNALKIQLAQERSKNRSLEDKARQCVKSLDNFMKQHEQSLTTHAHDLQTTRDVLQQVDNDSRKSCLSQFYDQHVAFLGRVGSILDYCERISKERVKLMELLKIQDSSMNHVMNGNDDHRPFSQNIDKDHLIRRLNKKVSDLEAECESYKEMLEQQKRLNDYGRLSRAKKSVSNPQQRKSRTEAYQPF